ncbi:hypothetical protein OFN04_29975, partial [Escherichia coli]|nr:hypothetical protein [Escherichia coli]
RNRAISSSRIRIARPPESKRHKTSIKMAAEAAIFIDLISTGYIQIKELSAPQGDTLGREKTPKLAKCGHFFLPIPGGNHAG